MLSDPTVRTRILMTLAALALLVAALVWLNRPQERVYTGPVAAERQQLSDVDVDRIVAMSLRSRVGETVSLARDGAAWFVREPYAFRFDWPRLQELRESFARLFAERLVAEDPDDRAQFGLDPPQVVAAAQLEDGSELEFYLGSATPDGNAFYLSSLHDSAVFTVRAVHATRFSWTAEDIRDISLPELDASGINRIWWRTGGGEVEILTAAEQPRYAHLAGTRIMRVPYEAAVAEEEFATLASRAASIAVVDRVADDAGSLAELGLQPPLAELHARDLDGQLDLLIGRAEGDDTYVSEVGSGIVYRVRTGQLLFLETDPFELTELAVLALPISRLVAIEAVASELRTRIDLAHSLDGRRELQTTARVGARQLRAEDLDRLLEAVASLQVDARAGEGETVGGSPSLTLTLHLEDSTEGTLVARFLPRDDVLHYLQLGAPPLRVVDSDKVERLTTLIREVAGR